MPWRTFSTSLSRRHDKNCSERHVMWPNSTETQELLLRAGQGDASAVEGLLDRHRDALRRIIALRMDRMIQQRVDASDIVQDVLVEANRRLQDYLREPK